MSAALISTIIAIALLLLAVALIFAHYKLKKMQKHNVLQNAANIGGIISAILALIIFAFPKLTGQATSGPTDYIVVTETAFANTTEGITEAQRKWLTRESAKLNARAALAATLKSQLIRGSEQDMGQLTDRNINEEVETVLILSEVVSEKYLADGSYQITMRVPRPKVK